MKMGEQRPAGSARRAANRARALRWAVGLGAGVMGAIGLVLVVQIGDDGNHVAIAFSHAPFEPSWHWIAKKARALGHRHPIDFPRFAKMFERSRKLGYLDRVMKAH